MWAVGGNGMLGWVGVCVLAGRVEVSIVSGRSEDFRVYAKVLGS